MPQKNAAYERNYYYALRTLARKKTVEALNSRIKNPSVYESWRGLTLGSIDSTAYDFARQEWPKHYGDSTHHGFVLSWERLYHKFAHRPSFFDLAIWQEMDGQRVLQALALGKPSNGKNLLILNWVERSFAPSYLKGGALLPILACAEEYTKLLGARKVLIKDPVDPLKYARYGYTPCSLPTRRGFYLEKDV